MVDLMGSSTGPSPDEEGFRDWMAVRMAPLRRKAFLLSGNWNSADDLVQETLITMFAGWHRLAQGRNVDAYANRVLVSKFIDGRRRPWRRERSVQTLPDVVDPGSAQAYNNIDGTDDLLRSALAALPVGQRAVLVLRYTDDLSLEEIARVMDLAVGTVKSRLSRGSDAVRKDLAERGHPLALSTASQSPTVPDTSLESEARHEH